MSAIRLIHANENGFVLTTSLIFLTIIGLLGSTAIVVTTTDIKIGGNYKDSRQAFYDADAGVQYTIKKIESDLAAGNISLPSSVGGSISLPYTTPSGFAFTLSTLTKTASDKYTFTSTGNGARNSKTSIETTLTRASAINYAAFGDLKTTLKNGSNIYSYDSGTTPNPAPGDSTGEGDVGSNVLLETKNGVYVDGGGVLGADASGTDGV
jgi:Tfp pilus assembly protein PilX